MKTKVGHYYVFFSLVDFWEKVDYWTSKGHKWIHNAQPIVPKNVLPVVLNVDDTTIMHGIIEKHKEKYFEDPTFVKLYNKSLREYKLKRILKC